MIGIPSPVITIPSLADVLGIGNDAGGAELVGLGGLSINAIPNDGFGTQAIVALNNADGSPGFGIAYVEELALLAISDNVSRQFMTINLSDGSTAFDGGASRTDGQGSFTAQKLVAEPAGSDPFFIADANSRQVNFGDTAGDGNSTYFVLDDNNQFTIIHSAQLTASNSYCQWLAGNYDNWGIGDVLYDQNGTAVIVDDDTGTIVLRAYNDVQIPNEIIIAGDTTINNFGIDVGLINTQSDRSLAIGGDVSFGQAVTCYAGSILLTPQSAAPATATAGMIAYYGGHFYGRNATQWKQLDN